MVSESKISDLTLPNMVFKSNKFVFGIHKIGFRNPTNRVSHVLDRWVAALQAARQNVPIHALQPLPAVLRNVTPRQAETAAVLQYVHETVSASEVGSEDEHEDVEGALVSVMEPIVPTQRFIAPKALLV